MMLRGHIPTAWQMGWHGRPPPRFSESNRMCGTGFQPVLAIQTYMKSSITSCSTRLPTYMDWKPLLR